MSTDGSLVVDATSKIKNKIHIGIMKSSKLKKNDVLIAIVGATIGKVALFDLNIEANINQAIAAVRLKSNILPQFLVAYMLSPVGQAYLEYLKRPVARANINLQEIGEIGIPLLSMEEQRRFAVSINKVRNIKNQKLELSKILIDGMDGYIHSILGMNEEIQDKPVIYAIKGSQAFYKRIDPEYHNPFYTHRISEIQKLEHDLLGNIVEFSTESWNQKDLFDAVFPYIEISGVKLKENEYETTDIPVEEAPSRAKMIARNGDIIVSTTRPHRGAIATIVCPDTQVQIASTGFCVLRDLKRDDVLKEYLQWILLDNYVLLQMLQRSSGGNYPAISGDELKKVVIPIPDIDIQREICKEARKRKTCAYALRQEAKEEWEQAKVQFEKELLGE